MSACARFVCVAKVGVELHLDGITNVQRAETWKKRKHSSVWGPCRGRLGLMEDNHYPVLASLDGSHF